MAKPRFLTLLTVALMAGAASAALAHSAGEAGHHHGARFLVAVPGSGATGSQAGERRWLAGDHHVHSRFSADYVVNAQDPTQPPTPVIGVDGMYSIPTNARKARDFGLSWMVSTDHGGPLHSKLNYEQAYPELVLSREQVPELIQFYGMEFDTPAGDHSSLIIPHTADEREALRDLESRFSRREAYPADTAGNTEQRMLEALAYMRARAAPPLVIANHPSRSATAVGEYGLYTPSELRNWNDTAPRVAVGMEGAPGHQAAAINPDGSLDPEGTRGGYGRSPTLGGFDQMTARLGGFWDSMLGEGRRWWVTSTSDSHRHFREGGSDFWPGEYSKTYVHASRSHSDILDGIRNGRVFVTTGDLISELDVVAMAPNAAAPATIGGALKVSAGQDVVITIRVRDPAGQNHAGRWVDVARVDLIVGDVTGPVSDRSSDTNPTARVVKRFTAADWRRDGEFLTMTHTLNALRAGAYLRVRGTNTAQLEPEPDPRGEDPWSDLWFYSNPIFLELAPGE
jgi:hypothetical protein